MSVHSRICINSPNDSYSCNPSKRPQQMGTDCLSSDLLSNFPPSIFLYIIVISLSALCLPFSQSLILSSFILTYARAHGAAEQMQLTFCASEA